MDVWRTPNCEPLEALVADAHEVVVANASAPRSEAEPRVVKLPCRSKQSEARGNLKALYVASESYRAENERFTSDVDA